MVRLRVGCVSNLLQGRSFLVLALGAALAGGTPTASANQDLLEYLARHPPAKQVLREYTEDQVDAIVPVWPNPYLSFLPAQARPDRDYWRARARFAGRDRREEMDAAASSAPAFPAAAIVASEAEPNDTQETANFLTGFGTGDGFSRRADVEGSIGLATPSSIAGVEDEGSIPLATETSLVSGSGVVASGSIGDGPHGSAGTGRGDFDFFRIPAVAVGEIIRIDVDTPIPFGPLDSFVVVYDSTGAVIAVNDDDGTSFDSFLAFPAPTPGDYYVSIGGFGSFSLNDPLDSSSGPRVGSEGSYDVFIGIDAGDVDFFSFDLKAGDILGARVSGAANRLEFHAPDGELRIGSSQDLTFIHPPASPLPGGGNAVLSYVAEVDGTYAIRVSGNPGAYALDLVVETSPLLDGAEGDVQTIFLDFDGAQVDLSRFGGPPFTVTLSPLASFLPRWGLSATDEDAVIDAIVAAVEDNISADMRTRGNNGDFDASAKAGEFDVEVLTSRDHADPFGSPNVSRVVIGGSVSEFGLLTIGIAESIDVGNFDTDEDAVVLLDFLSGPARDRNSLNSIPRAGGATIIDVIGAGVGNIASHEAGHYSGNWHTEQFVTVPNIMDQGGNLAGIVGVGPDGIFGTSDDIDVDFGRDRYVPNEGFVGVEDTLNTVAFGCPTPVITLQIGLDVLPSGDPNVVNTQSNGLVQVAILGAPSFDVADIDPTTLAFGPGGALPENDGSTRDVDRDGTPDRVFMVRTQGTSLAAGDEELCVSGAITDGTEFEGCDAVTTLPRTCGFGLPGGGGGSFQSEGPENGGFETGDFTAWTLLNSGSGGIAIDDGSFFPPGPGGPVVPFEGAFASVSFQGGPGVHTWTTDVTLDPDPVEARLAWADHLQNHAGVFQDPVQEWRVEVWDPSDNSVLAELFSTESGDPTIQDWTQREADLTPWIGQTIRLAFTQQDGLFFFNARLDAVEVRVRRRIDIDVDVRPGNPNNVVNPMSRGTVPVALLGSSSFDVSDVDAVALGFGPGHAPPEHDICEPTHFASHVRDVDHDGDDDLVVHFRIPGSQIPFGATEVCVRAATSSGDEVRGCDAIQAVPACGIGFELALLLPALQLLYVRSRRRRVRWPIRPAGRARRGQSSPRPIRSTKLSQ